MPRKRTLTDKQAAYIENQSRGLPSGQSAIMAGYDPGTSETDIEASPNVRAELARIRAETAANCGITKEDVVQMFMDAAQMGRLMADPQGLIAAAREIGKMLGYYAPEVKKVLHGMDKSEIKKALELMPDEELFKLANARAIDGESRRIPESLPEVQREQDEEPVLQQSGELS